MHDEAPVEERTGLRRWNVLPLVAVAAVAGVFAYRQGLLPDFGQRASYSVETLPQSQAIEFVSPITGADYVLLVQPPHGYYESDKRYPVFYVLNAPASISVYSSMVLPLLRERTIPEAIFVGIAHGRWTPFAEADPRMRDFTIVPEPGFPSRAGGAEKMLAFFRDNIIPFIDATYRTKPNDRGLGGHSLDAQFVLYAALKEPELFQRYVASSPMLDHGEFAMLAFEEETASTRQDLPIALYLSVAEHDYPSCLQGWQHMTDALLGRRYPNLRFEYQVHAGHDHNSVVFAAARNGLTFVYKDSGD